MLFSILTPEKNISGVLPLQYSSLYNVKVDRFLIFYLFSAEQLPEDGYPPFSTFHPPWKFCPQPDFTIVWFHSSHMPLNNPIPLPATEEAPSFPDSADHRSTLLAGTLKVTRISTDASSTEI